MTPEERKRNGLGSSTVFKYSGGETRLYPSSLPGFFPDLARCTCVMEEFNLPTLDGLHLVPGLCDGVFLGAEALAGFPTLQTLPHTALLAYHGVNVHGSESKNRSMVIHIQNPFEGRKTEEIANDRVGKRCFVGWPFVREALCVAVSDSLFKYEMVNFGDGKQKKVLSNPHTPVAVNYWKQKVDRIEHFYSKRLGVITGSVEVMLHVRPLKGTPSSIMHMYTILTPLPGMKRLDTGAFVKEYESENREYEQALQMTVSEVISEDPRFIEKEPPPISEEFEIGSKVFFLGDHAYGVAAQVSETAQNSLAVMLAVSKQFIPVFE